MSRNTSRGLAILQKTYDDSYLKCSTAVYYESQGNENEAMRCWRNALNQLSDHRASKVLPDFVPRSETEKALIDSLRELELQCKERIDLLEALRISRQENTGRASSSSSEDRFSKPRDSTDSLPSPRDKGWIGQGTIPAVTYPELSRPAVPKRPSLPSRTTSEKATAVGKFSESDSGPDLSSAPFSPVPSGASPRHGTKDADIRSASPEKHTMRTTLRSGKSGERAPKPSRKLAKNEGPGASKAATLAWSALGAKERITRVWGSNSEASSSNAGPPSATSQVSKSPGSPSLKWDAHTRRLVSPRDAQSTRLDPLAGRHSDEISYGQPSAFSVNAASSALKSLPGQETFPEERSTPTRDRGRNMSPQTITTTKTYRGDAPGFSEPDTSADRWKSTSYTPPRRKVIVEEPHRDTSNAASGLAQGQPTGRTRVSSCRSGTASEASSLSDHPSQTSPEPKPARRKPKSKLKPPKPNESDTVAGDQAKLEDEDKVEDSSPTNTAWKKRKKAVLKSLPSGVDEASAKQILNEIVVQGDEVRWGDVAGLEIAKNALRETVVYPFLRPDLFMGLREPARGMLLFGPPGTGKTMLARAVATESRSTFFSISASSLTSKFLGESEKLVRALFQIARELAPSIIFVDEIDSLLSQRSGSGEHEATRRIKTEFLIQWSDLQRAAAGRAVDDNDKDRGDANRVLVLAATNMPWAIDEAARRRFVRRQYIPLPEPETRSTQLRALLGEQKHTLSEPDIEKLVTMTDGFSGSDITALAKDAAMGPLRSLGEALLHMTMDEIRPINLGDFEASLTTIRPSVSQSGLKEYEDWAKEFGERGG